MEASYSKDTSHLVRSLSEGKYLDSRELSYREVPMEFSVWKPAMLHALCRKQASSSNLTVKGKRAIRRL